jgi:mannonate dehydratase
MRQTWRWFGPRDLVSVDDMLQAGVEGVVSALHHVPTGAAWTPEEIARRQREIATRKDGSASGIAWEVVESLPVSEDVKKQKGAWRAHLDAYRRSLRNLAAAGIEVVCYNFMPVLDWTRTDLAFRVSHGGTCMRFDLIDFAAFDIHVLARPGAAEDFPEAVRAEAEARFAAMDEARKAELARNVVFGLPGSVEGMTLADVRAHLAEYGRVSQDQLRRHFVDFLAEVVPTAEEVGIRLCCHPDDPPFALLGLPRIMSTADDYAAILAAVDSPANGMTLCTGSLGARPDNDLPAMMRRFADRVHFLHLRNVRREGQGIRGSFHEAEHLGGDTDMVAVIAAVVEEEARRRAAGRADASIPFRPDHGQDILDDLGRRGQPGYPAIGRLKGLAELRGIMTALEHPVFGLAARGGARIGAAA